MSEPLVLVDRRDDGVAVVTLNNGKVNALSGAVTAAIAEVAADLSENPPGAVTSPSCSSLKADNGYSDSWKPLS